MTCLYLCIYLSTYLSSHMFSHPSIHPFIIYLFIHPCVRLSIHLCCASGLTMPRRPATTGLHSFIWIRLGCEIGRKSACRSNCLDCLAEALNKEHSETLFWWNMPIHLNVCLMTDLRFRQLVSFIAMHPGPFLVHDSKGTENAAVIAALIRMLLFKETSGAAVFCWQWCGLGHNFTNERMNITVKFLLLPPIYQTRQTGPMKCGRVMRCLTSETSIPCAPQF